MKIKNKINKITLNMIFPIIIELILSIYLINLFINNSYHLYYVLFFIAFVSLSLSIAFVIRLNTVKKYIKIKKEENNYFLIVKGIFSSEKVLISDFEYCNNYIKINNKIRFSKYWLENYFEIIKFVKIRQRTKNNDIRILIFGLTYFFSILGLSILISKFDLSIFVNSIIIILGSFLIISMFKVWKLK